MSGFGLNWQNPINVVFKFPLVFNKWQIACIPKNSLKIKAFEWASVNVWFMNLFYIHVCQGAYKIHWVSEMVRGWKTAELLPIPMWVRWAWIEAMDVSSLPEKWVSAQEKLLVVVGRESEVLEIVWARQDLRMFKCQLQVARQGSGKTTAKERGRLKCKDREKNWRYCSP